jgi:hypothetical protein
MGGDIMKTFKRIGNTTLTEEMALVEVSANNKVILNGDYYHDKIQERIEGFLYALSYYGIEYNIEETEYISPQNDLFKKLGFENDNYLD